MRWRKGEPQPTGTAECESEPASPDRDYTRRVYETNREWYRLVETKAQIVIAANGAFLSLFFGGLLGGSGARAISRDFSLDTWIFLGCAAVSILAAIAAAGVSLWSWHGHGIKKEFERLGVNPESSVTYRPEVLWYFGHIARLNPSAVTEMLRRPCADWEITTLSYDTVDLATKVLRKHRYVNAAWACSALGLASIVLAAGSYLLHQR